MCKHAAAQHTRSRSGVPEVERGLSEHAQALLDRGRAQAAHFAARKRCQVVTAEPEVRLARLRRGQQRVARAAGLAALAEAESGRNEREDVRSQRATLDAKTTALVHERGLPTRKPGRRRSQRRAGARARRPAARAAQRLRRESAARQKRGACLTSFCVSYRVPSAHASAHAFFFVALSAPRRARTRLPHVVSGRHRVAEVLGAGGEAQEGARSGVGLFSMHEQRGKHARQQHQRQLAQRIRLLAAVARRLRHGGGQRGRGAARLLRGRADGVAHSARHIRSLRARVCLTRSASTRAAALTCSCCCCAASPRARPDDTPGSWRRGAGARARCSSFVFRSLV
jgi:hypothetical protein